MGKYTSRTGCELLYIFSSSKLWDILLQIFLGYSRLIKDKNHTTSNLTITANYELNWKIGKFENEFEISNGIRILVILIW